MSHQPQADPQDDDPWNTEVSGLVNDMLILLWGFIRVNYGPKLALPDRTGEKCSTCPICGGGILNQFLPTHLRGHSLQDLRSALARLEVERCFEDLA